jgi:ABC-type thiamine transport system ATPase subunit
MFLCAAGIGKSTLLNLIGGTLEPTVGHITRNAKVQAGHTACWSLREPLSIVRRVCRR